MPSYNEVLILRNDNLVTVFGDKAIRKLEDIAGSFNEPVVMSYIKGEGLKFSKKDQAGDLILATCGKAREYPNALEFEVSPDNTIFLDMLSYKNDSNILVYKDINASDNFIVLPFQNKYLDIEIIANQFTDKDDFIALMEEAKSYVDRHRRGKR